MVVEYFQIYEDLGVIDGIESTLSHQYHYENV